MGPLRILAIVVVACLALAGVIALGISSWIDSHRVDLSAAADEARTEGVLLARSMSQDGCLAIALQRLSNCELLCQVKTKVMLQSCGSEASPSEGFCDGVPPPEALMATAQWSLSRCEALGHSGSQGCARVVAGIQDVCFRQPSSADAPANPHDWLGTH